MTKNNDDGTQMVKAKCKIFQIELAGNSKSRITYLKGHLIRHAQKKEKDKSQLKLGKRDMGD